MKEEYVIQQPSTGLLLQNIYNGNQPKWTTSLKMAWIFKKKSKAQNIRDINFDGVRGAFPMIKDLESAKTYAAHVGTKLA